ncbi:TetR-like C-terminal domain-containing protein, partial [Ilumatobacter sp.]|uniref:TetR-like C-terminal domain-containing protein n=1 Tax=Ilumatobacter sp. TaxID=1967498 RepID=UPI003C5B48CD
PDTGGLEGDLIELNRSIQSTLSDDSSLVVAVIAAAFRDPDAAAALRRFWDDRYLRSEVVIDRAIARGEAPDDVDAHALLVASTGPLYHHRLLLGHTLTVDDADHYARFAAHAATAPTATTSLRPSKGTSNGRS